MPNTSLHISSLVRRRKWRDYRDEIWGDAYNWAQERSLGDVTYLVIHHSATVLNAMPDDIAAFHKERGWGGVGYHFVITADGVVYYVGDIATARANVENMNSSVIGICLVGDFTQDTPTKTQIFSTHDLCSFFIQESTLPKITNWDSVKGHKDLQATACPGTSWPDAMRSSIVNRKSLKSRLKKSL